MRNAAEILIIRHGQTDWNAIRRLQGHSDIPLNETGLEQARTLGRLLSEEKLDAIVSSDLLRAHQTAAEVAKWHSLPVLVDQSFRERSYGAFEGLVRSEIRHRFPGSYPAWLAVDPDHILPSGLRPSETIRSLHERATKAICTLGARFGGKKVALVTHYGIVKSAYRAAKKISLDERIKITVKNASINRFLVCQDMIELLAWEN